MPCLEESPREVDFALQLLDIMTSRPNIDTQVTDSPVVREITQTDHLNKRLLINFLEHMNVMEVPAANGNSEDDENAEEFEE